MVYYTAITLKLNTKPWKENGITSRENYLHQLNNLANKFNCKLDKTIGCEMDKCCQLHVHCIIINKKILHRVTICKYYKSIFKNHSIWLEPVNNLENWRIYCKKANNEEEKDYHYLCKFYYDNSHEFDINKYQSRKDCKYKINNQKHWEKKNLYQAEAEFID